jgi:glucose-induced degradation protein 8
VEPNVDLNSLDHRIRVRDAIQSGNIQSAVAMVNELHPELLDNDRFLFFHLQVRRIFMSRLQQLKWL